MIAKLFVDTKPAVVVALVAGLVVAGLRLTRRQSLQQVVGGLFGLAFAAVLAVKLNGGDGTGFFLPGVVISVAYCLAFGISVLVRRPLTGVLVAAVAGTGPGWREDREQRRAHLVTSLGWTLLYGTKAGVQGYLLAAGYGTTELGVVRLVMGYPLFLGALALSALYLRRHGALTPAPDPLDPDPLDPEPVDPGPVDPVT